MITAVQVGVPIEYNKSTKCMKEKIKEIKTKNINNKEYKFVEITDLCVNTCYNHHASFSDITDYTVRNILGTHGPVVRFDIAFMKTYMKIKAFVLIEPTNTYIYIASVYDEYMDRKMKEAFLDYQVDMLRKFIEKEN